MPRFFFPRVASVVVVRFPFLLSLMFARLPLLQSFFLCTCICISLNGPLSRSCLSQAPASPFFSAFSWMCMCLCSFCNTLVSKTQQNFRFLSLLFSFPPCVGSALFFCTITFVLYGRLSIQYTLHSSIDS